MLHDVTKNKSKLRIWISKIDCIYKFRGLLAHLDYIINEPKNINGI